MPIGKDGESVKPPNIDQGFRYLWSKHSARLVIRDHSGFIFIVLAEEFGVRISKPDAMDFIEELGDDAFIWITNVGHVDQVEQRYVETLYLGNVVKEHEIESSEYD